MFSLLGFTLAWSPTNAPPSAKIIFVFLNLISVSLIIDFDLYGCILRDLDIRIGYLPVDLTLAYIDAVFLLFYSRLKAIFG